MEELLINRNKFISLWWSKRRKRYNVGLILAGITAFLLSTILASYLIAPYVDDFEISLFTILFQATGYLFMMGIANLLYFLGPAFDRIFNKEDSERFRIRLFNLGYWFSIGLPLIIPVIIVIEYLCFIENKQ